MNIPFVDLKQQHVMLKEELHAVIEYALVNGHFVGGEQVKQFEIEFAQFCGAPYAVGVNSGTDALLYAFLAAGIQPGDEIITIPNTFIATTEAISQAGARIVFADIDPATHLMDPGKLRDAVRCRIDKGAPLRAIVPVHLYGQVAPMEEILAIASEFDLIVIEDACQAHGAVYQNSDSRHHDKKAGSMGTAGCFSFYPGKNLGSCGEGGAVVTDDEEIASRIRMLREHGQKEKYIHEIEGYNGRLHAMQAGILRVKLRHLSDWNQKRRKTAERYRALLNETREIMLPPDLKWSQSVYHLFVVMMENRDEIQKRLQEKGVATGLHYPIPLHLQKAYQSLGYKKGELPCAETNAQKILSLPMFPEMTEEQVIYVCSVLKEAVRL